VIEFVSGTGAEERVGVASPWEDRTPWTGKFWVYETAIRPAYYAIYEVKKAAVEVYVLQKNQYQLLPANERGHFPIEELGVELGIWPGVYQAMDLPWLRWWDRDGNLLLHGEEQAIQSRQEAEQERQRAELERQRAELEHQRANQAAQQVELEHQRAEQAAQQAELERQRAEQAIQQAQREQANTQKLRAKLTELGIDPDTVL